MALAICATAGCAGPSEAQDHRYDGEYPHMDYLRARGDNPVTRLLASGGVPESKDVFDGTRTDVRPLLSALGISEASQVLVFSKTSLQAEFIEPERPRAIYFNDDTYVAVAMESGSVEVSTFDPALGPMFYLLRPSEDRLTVTRQNDMCLSCHDSYSLTGGGVPRFLAGSGPTLASGELASHGSWLLTTDETPLSRRWGGWYVTGVTGPTRHLGNHLTVPGSEPPAEVSLLHSVSDRIDASPYPTPYSDIAALMVLEHQLHVQNQLSRLMWEAERRPADEPAERQVARIDRAVTAVVAALTQRGAPTFDAPVEGSSGFREHFESLGLRDGDGRSFRELDLGTRLFRYPVSPVIYHAAIDQLPRELRGRVFAGLTEALKNLDPEAWPAGAGAAALDILADTHTAFADWRGEAN